MIIAADRHNAADAANLLTLLKDIRKKIGVCIFSFNYLPPLIVLRR